MEDGMKNRKGVEFICDYKQGGPYNKALQKRNEPCCYCRCRVTIVVVELLLSWSIQLEIPEVPSRAPLSLCKACACAGVNGLPSA
jgi:hypothetical protein